MHNKITRYRKWRNRFHQSWMMLALFAMLFIPLVLVAGLIMKSMLLLKSNSLLELLFSPDWSPMVGHFGFLPFIVSSLWVTILALLFSAPICILTSIHLTQYARRWVLRVMHPVIDILAGIPSVIFGVWGILVVVPFISQWIGPLLGKSVTGYSILAGAIVLAIMIIPFMLNMLIDVMHDVPDELQEASFSLGASKWQTIKRVVVKKALPGIVSSFGLGMSRAFGETIAVLMVVGNVTRIPTGTLQPGYPLPALIANNYGEMLSIPMYDSALMLAALILLVVVLLFNVLSRWLIMKTETV